MAIVRRKLPNNAEALLIDAMIDRHQNRWDASLANLQKASELDPRNGEVAYRLEQIYFEMRRYSELEQFIKKQAASGGPRDRPTRGPFQVATYDRSWHRVIQWRLNLFWIKCRWSMIRPI